MRMMAVAVLVVVAGAFMSWLALVAPAVIRYDPTRTNE